MLNKQLQTFLEGNHIHYSVIQHKPAYTAQEIAEVAHIKGKSLAKIVMIKVDGKLAMVVGSAAWHINLNALKKQIKASIVELASEYEFQESFPDVEVGAMPPFGNLFGMDVYVDDGLLLEKEIAFNGGNHTELVKMSYQDWAKWVKPKIVHIH